MPCKTDVAIACTIGIDTERPAVHIMWARSDAASVHSSPRPARASADLAHRDTTAWLGCSKPPLTLRKGQRSDRGVLCLVE
jgi:hypothetical protein